MNIVCSYKGASNLDETLDDNISYLIGKYCYDNKIDLKILNLDFVKSVPNINDELIRSQIEIGINADDFNSNWILKELEVERFDKGLTIKSEKDEILYVDEYTADFKYRRKLKNGHC